MVVSGLQVISAAVRQQPFEALPATLVLQGQVWALVREGLLVTDEYQVDRVFLVCEPSTYYFRIMTRGEWMPVLIGERF